MTYLLRRSLVVLASLALLMAAACDDNSSNTQVNGENNDFRDATGENNTSTNTNNPVENNPVVVSDEDTLSLVSEQPIRIAHSSDVILRVLHETKDGIPIPGALINVAIVSTAPDADCHLDALPCIQVLTLTGQTLEDGIADIAFKARTRDTDVTISFSVDGRDDVDPVEAVIEIRAKDSYDLIVQFEYNGQRDFRNITPLLYDPEPSSTLPNPPTTCKDIYLVDSPRSTNDFFETIARPAPDVARNPDGSIEPALYTSLRRDKVYIAAGYAKTAAGETIFVYGCSDEAPQALEGANPVMTVELIEVPMLLVGTYDLTSNFDLFSALPQRATTDDDYLVGDWVRTIIHLFADPGDQLLIWLLEIPLIGDNLDPTLQAITAEVLSSAIEAFAPEWLQDTISVGGDLESLLEQFQLEGELQIVSEPGPCADGSGDTCLVNEQKHIYNAITFSWNLSLPVSMQDACGVADRGTPYITCTLSGLTGKSDLNLVSGTWGGSFENDMLVIDTHGVLIPYGDILLGTIENLVLPTLFDDGSVNSLSAMVERLLLDAFVEYYNTENPANVITTGGCAGAGEAIGRLILGDGPFASLIGSAAEAICVEAIDAMQTYVEEFATSLVLDTEDGMTFETPSGQACPAFDSDSNLVFDTLGGDVDRDRCHWLINLNIGNSNSQIDGLFNAAVK